MSSYQGSPQPGNGCSQYWDPTRQQPPSPQYVMPSQLFQQSPAQILQPSSSSIDRTMTPQVFTNPARMASLSSDSLSDEATLLISLAEEFFEAAHKLAPAVSISMTPANVQTYERLIATGLGCLQSVLERGRLTPRVEANVRLRYAGILHEETTNTMEAETTLSKGIGLCERNKYFDLKYASQYLLARIIAQKTPKAAMKALDGHISEAEAYQHFSWVYALRFLRASFALASGNPADTHAAIHNFQKIADLSTRLGDKAIHLTASLMEAMAYMRSSGTESIELVQRAIAAARTHQLDVGNNIPQLNGLTYVVDLMCSIRQGYVHQMLSKLKDMQVAMDGLINNPKWSLTSDVIAIPINGNSRGTHTVSKETRAVLSIGEDGRDNLMMSFLSKKDAYSINYLLCGAVLLHKAPNDQRGLKYLEEGLVSLSSHTQSTSKIEPGLLPELAFNLQWRGEILCYFRLYRAAQKAIQSNWSAIKRDVDEVTSTARHFHFTLTGPLEYLTMYLTGVYHQGSGDLDSALNIFQDPKFSLNFSGSNPTSTEQVERDFSLLAALNTLWILQEKRRQNPALNTSLIAILEPLCATHPNKDIQTAFNLVVSTCPTIPPAQLFTIKNKLGFALSGAQSTGNTQFLCFTLNIMCSRFFSNVVGLQAEKSAMAASIQATKSQSLLWRSVADGMLAKTFEVQGKMVEAAKCAEQASKYAGMANQQK